MTTKIDLKQARDNPCYCEHSELTHESHEQLEIIPAKMQVLHHKRLKYACLCCSSYLVTANKPAQPIEKSIASPALLAYVTTQKYVDGLPLYRQTEIFKRIEIEMDRGTLATWMVKCGQVSTITDKFDP